MQYGDVKIKQCSKVTYLGCELDESLSSEAMAFNLYNFMIYIQTIWSKPSKYEIFCFETKLETWNKISLLVDAVGGTSTVKFSIN